MCESKCDANLKCFIKLEIRALKYVCSKLHLYEYKRTECEKRF